MSYVTGSSFSNRLVEYCCIYGHARAAFRHSGQAGGPTLLESDLKGECYRRVPSSGMPASQTPMSPDVGSLKRSISNNAMESKKESVSAAASAIDMDEIDDSQFPFGVELFVFPTGVHLSRTKKSPSFHSFVLTVGDGSRVYGYAFISHRRLHAKKLSLVRMQTAAQLMSQPDAKVTDMPERLWVPEAVVLLSRHPYHRQFSRLMNAFCLQHIPTGNDSEHLPGELVKQLYKSLNYPAPIPQSPPLMVTLCGASAKFEAKSSEEPPLAECDFRLLCGAMEPRRVITVVTALMCEVPVLLYSAHIDILTPALEAIQALIYPLKWPYIYIPLLPTSLVDILEAPQPYLIGAPAEVLNEPPWPADALLIDLDNNTMSCPRKLELMPWRLSWRLYDCMVKHFNVFQILHPSAQLNPPDGLPDSAKVRDGFGVTLQHGNNKDAGTGPQNFGSARVSAVMTLKTVNTLHDGSEPDDSDAITSEDEEKEQQGREEELLEEESAGDKDDKGDRPKQPDSLRADYVLVTPKQVRSHAPPGRGHARTSAAHAGTHAPASSSEELMPVAGPSAPQGSSPRTRPSLLRPGSIVDSFVSFFRFKASRAGQQSCDNSAALPSAPVNVRVRPERLRRSFLSVFVSLFKYYRQHISITNARSPASLPDTPTSFFGRQASGNSISSSGTLPERPSLRALHSRDDTGGGRGSPIISATDSPSADEDLQIFNSEDFLNDSSEDLRPFLSMLVETQMFHEFIVERLQATKPDWFDGQVLKRVTREAEAHHVNREKAHEGLLWKIGSKMPTWNERLFTLDGMLLVYSKQSDKISQLKHKARSAAEWAAVRPQDKEAQKRLKEAEKAYKEHAEEIEKGRLELVEGRTDVTIPSDSQQFSSIFSSKLKTPYVFVITIYDDNKAVLRRLVCCAHSGEERREWIRLIQARVHAPKPLFRLFKPETSMKKKMEKKKNRMLEKTLTHVRQVQIRKGARLHSVVQEEDDLETESDRDSSATQ